MFFVFFVDFFFFFCCEDMLAVPSLSPEAKIDVMPDSFSTDVMAKNVQFRGYG